MVGSKIIRSNPKLIETSRAKGTDLEVEGKEVHLKDTILRILEVSSMKRFHLVKGSRKAKNRRTHPGNTSRIKLLTVRTQINATRTRATTWWTTWTRLMTVLTSRCNRPLTPEVSFCRLVRGRDRTSRTRIGNKEMLKEEADRETRDDY